VRVDLALTLIPAVLPVLKGGGRPVEFLSIVRQHVTEFLDGRVELPCHDTGGTFDWKHAVVPDEMDV